MVDFVEFTFKDNFISRADMWRFKNAIYGKAVYIGACLPASLLLDPVSTTLLTSPTHTNTGQHFNVLGIRARVKELSRGEEPVLSGLLQEDSKMTFRFVNLFSSPPTSSSSSSHSIPPFPFPLT